MAYPFNPYYPATYTPYVQTPSQTPQISPTTPASSNGGLVWVQGETGAKSYLVAPNTTVLLMDSEALKFYIKSTDNSGMPMPLRVFEYKEVGNQQTPQGDFVTREEFEKKIAELSEKKTKKEVKADD